MLQTLPPITPGETQVHWSWELSACYDAQLRLLLGIKYFLPPTFIFGNMGSTSVACHLHLHFRMAINGGKKAIKGIMTLAR